MKKLVLIAAICVCGPAFGQDHPADRWQQAPIVCDVFREGSFEHASCDCQNITNDIARLECHDHTVRIFQLRGLAAQQQIEALAANPVTAEAMRDWVEANPVED